MKAYRIVGEKWKDRIWTGEGSFKHDGRWHTHGHHVVYLSETLALATLETLVHLHKKRRLARFYMAWAEVPEKLIDTFDIRKLPLDWQEPEYPASTQILGDRWLEGKSALALRIPSVIVPREWDLLINPQHPDFSKIHIHPSEILPIDPRLIR